MYFLTEIDPNIDVKSSRDPLGLQPIWSALGRRFVAHLTTVTTSLRGFSTLLLGLELAERALEAKRAFNPQLREKERLACFLRFEQLAAYSRRVVHKATDIRGINRVKRRLDEGQSIVSIGEADEHQILAEQKTYGLWGLYMTAARGSGLVEHADARPTESVREHIAATIAPTLGRSVMRELAKWLCDEGRRFEPRARDREIAKALGRALGPRPSPDERSFLGEALIQVAPERDTTRGSQRQLWNAMRGRDLDWKSKCTYTDVQSFWRDAPAGSDLRTALEQVLAIEPLLAFCDELFAYLVGGRKMKKIAAIEGCRNALGKGAFRHLRRDAVTISAEIIDLAAGAGTSATLGHILDALAADDFDHVISLLLDHNDSVMRARGGLGWVDCSSTELRPRLYQRPKALPAREELTTLWRNTYFLDALRWLGAEIDALSEPSHEH